MQRVALGRHRNRLELLGVALAAVDQQAQRVRGVEVALVDRAELRLVDGLSGIEGLGRRVDAARVGLHLGPRQPERVLRLRQVEAVDDDRQLARAIGQPGELGVAELALGFAVVAVAVGLEHARADDVAEAAVGAARLGGDAAGVEAAQAAAGRERGRAAPLFAEHLDHAARRVAVERRERAAQHLDAIGRAELDVGDLALAVGQGRGDAVDIEAHAADAEGRARAEAADRELHVLGVVLPVARHQAGHAAQAFREVDLRLAFADRLAADAVDRCRHVERRHLGAGGGDDHRRQPDGRLAGSALRQGGGGQRHRPERRAGAGPACGAS